MSGPVFNRRTLLAIPAASFLAAGCKRAVQIAPKPLLTNDTALQELEQQAGGRLGVACINAAGEVLLSNRADERFAMCSTFKAPLAIALFEAHDKGLVDRNAKVTVREADLVPYAPFVEKLVAERRDTTLDELAYQAVIISDNAAANIVLRAIGGLEAFTKFLRRHGDDISRLDRYEPELNENAVGDPRDTTSPLAMAELLRQLMVADGRNETHGDTLIKWMRDTTTGKDRILAGLPQGWELGHKTGTAPRSAPSYNDTGILFPPGQPPALLSIYFDRPALEAEKADAAIAEAARAAVQKIVVK